MQHRIIAESAKHILALSLKWRFAIVISASIKAYTNCLQYNLIHVCVSVRKQKMGSIMKLYLVIYHLV
jgi:hypothetical protein